MNKEIKILNFQYMLSQGELKKELEHAKIYENPSVEAELLPYLNTGWNITHVAGDGGCLFVFLERFVV